VPSHHQEGPAGNRPSEQIALRVTDCDVAQGKIKIDKARVVARDKDRTKTSEDRIVELRPRALQVLKRHLAFRARLKLEGKISHEDLFFKEDGTPIRNLQCPWVRWRRTLTVTLKGRYREPDNARHSSATWNLMIGKDPLWVAKQHGHSVQTMLETYAAWLEGTTESDMAAITRAMDGSTAVRIAARKPAVSARSTPAAVLSTPPELSLRCLQTGRQNRNGLIIGGKYWRRERDSNPRRAFDSP
jgi:integrase